MGVGAVATDLVMVTAGAAITVMLIVLNVSMPMDGVMDTDVVRAVAPVLMLGMSKNEMLCFECKVTQAELR
jgi:hypothetical protein